MEAKKVGIREFRAHMPQYWAGEPVAITRHGVTIGYYIPAQNKDSDNDIAKLQTAVAQLQELLKAHGVSEDELATEFHKMRRAGKRHESPRS